jgi:hypothetical protein
MPRGNDPDAERDFKREYGDQGNAEKLIQAHRASFSADLLAAQRKPVDNRATEALDLSSLSGPNGETILSAAVRGGKVIGVWLDEDETHKTGILDEDAPEGEGETSSATGGKVASSATRAKAQQEAKDKADDK